MTKRLAIESSVLLPAPLVDHHTQGGPEMKHFFDDPLA
ncbi:Uncharacterised protein [Vibrio cholerae]|nr:Uncharacterised protein [Vibrio cholerae]